MNPDRATKISTLSRCLLLFCLACFSTVQADIPLPESFSATYTLHKGPIQLAKMTRRLYKNDAGNFVYESFSEPVGIALWFTDSTLLEKTEWFYHNDQLRPLHYSYKRESSRKNRHVKLNFDWEKLRVVNDINNDPWSMQITEDTLDKLLYHLSVMVDLKRKKTSLSYQIADGGRLKTYHFKNLGKERIETKLGSMETIKLEYLGKRPTTLWCAPQLNYLPVQLEQEEDGTQLTLKLQSVTGLPY